MRLEIGLFCLFLLARCRYRNMRRFFVLRPSFSVAAGEDLAAPSSFITFSHIFALPYY